MSQKPEPSEATEPHRRNKKQRGFEPTRDPTPFERFTEFTRRIIAVPKAEVEKQKRMYRKRRRNKKPRRAT